MENKKGFYDEIYENYKNFSLTEVEELFSRYNEEEKEIFIKMLEKCCLKRDLKKELIEEEIQEKEKIGQEYKEYEEKLLVFIEKMVLMVAGYISFALNDFNIWKIRDSGILGFPLIMLLGALLLKRALKYRIYKREYEKICRESYLENKISKFNCDSFIEICILTLIVFVIQYFFKYIIFLPKIAEIVSILFVMIYLFIILFNSKK